MKINRIGKAYLMMSLLPERMFRLADYPHTIRNCLEPGILLDDVTAVQP
ncbi:MAG: hypothetical protein ACI4QT_02640 [Kiritimatiellia bacterium]